MFAVGNVQPGVIDVEGVGVLHHEFAPAQDAGPGAGLVPVLGLDLVDRQRQILVGGVEVLHQQGEHLLMGGTEQHVIALTILEPEEVVAVLDPAIRALVWFARQQRGEMHLLEPGGVHLLAHHALDIAKDPVAKR